ncbi:carbohydrate kinase family protein [Tenggerimyces flavus]|uniref:Carbohydrate kinase family protein n=1 Tax=Tenggerimyces flavus TaxID=1708749 RepID=A0ABV7Y518_9ACTN|nr:carbohydrate kinase family protein [Tenggerimyces flavus]MBM7788247.1 sugar/nucleoside kinase (ribokinase family) [Tenggerimyces flavus]
MPSAKEIDLLVVGDANPDVIVSGAPEHPSFGHEELVDGGELVLGGSGAITACGAARLGLRTAFVGRVGNDEAGRFVLDALRRRDVDVSACVVDSEAPTALTVVLVHGKRHAMLTSRGALERVEAADVPESLLARTSHVHSSALFLHPTLQKTLPSLFAAAHEVGATTSVDTNDDPSGTWSGLDAVLPTTDVLLVNESEARGLAGLEDLEAAARALAALGPMPVVKCGVDGGLAYSDGGSVVRAPAAPAEVVDTVGAGDTFNAGFLAARLRGLPLAESLAVAVRCGTLSTRAAGGTAAQPTWEEATS